MEFLGLVYLSQERVMMITFVDWRLADRLELMSVSGVKMTEFGFGRNHLTYRVCQYQVFFDAFLP